MENTIGLQLSKLGWCKNPLNNVIEYLVKTNMRKIKGRLSALGLQKIKPVKEKRNNNNTKPEPEEIRKILQHKIYRNGKIKLKVKWDNGDEEWCNDVLVKKDFPSLVQNYFDGLPNDSRINDDYDEDTYNCPIDHEEFNIGITYKEEPNYLYWTQNGSMEGILCSNCNGDFTSDACRPTNKFPAYTCMKRTKGCSVCYCYKCFH